MSTRDVFTTLFDDIPNAHDHPRVRRSTVCQLDLGIQPELGLLTDPGDRNVHCFAGMA